MVVMVVSTHGELPALSVTATLALASALPVAAVPESVAAAGVAVLLGMPLGLLAARRRVKQPILAVVGVLQTIPSLALLAMLIPLVGSIGVVPALIALALYALLPIVRNTIVGLEQVPDGLRDAALALGFTPWQRTRVVDLPLALPVILAGIKTAAVISVGTATSCSRAAPCCPPTT